MNDLTDKFRVETRAPTGLITSSEPIFTEEEAQSVADRSNRRFGKEGFHSTVKQGPKPPDAN